MILCHLQGPVSVSVLSSHMFVYSVLTYLQYAYMQYAICLCLCVVCSVGLTDSRVSFIPFRLLYQYLSVFRLLYQYQFFQGPVSASVLPVGVSVHRGYCIRIISPRVLYHYQSPVSVSVIPVSESREGIVSISGWICIRLPIAIGAFLYHNLSFM